MMEGEHMFNKSGITKTNLMSVNQILANVDLQASVGCVVGDTGATKVGNKKIIKAGTPLAGDLDKRTTPFTLATGEETGAQAIGVLLHDVDVTNGNANGTILIFGFVNKNRLDEDVKALITKEVVEALDGKVTFISM